MLSAIRIHAAGTWTGAPADVLPLPTDGRKRLVMRTPQGLSFFLELPGADALKDGDAIELDDGRLVAVAEAGHHHVHDENCGHDHSHDHHHGHDHDGHEPH
jgi:urease accessory protein